MKKKLLKITTIAGLFIMSITTANAFTAVASGNWSSAATWGGVAPGATVTSQDITIPSGLTVNLDMDVTFSGVINSFTVNGTLNNSAAHFITMSQGGFAGSGSVTIDRLSFTSVLATMSYTGTMAVNHFENSGATLTIAAIISVADTLNLDAGSILLNTGSNLAVMTNSTIRINSGSMTIGGGVFNSSSNYSVLYVGASKTSGIELNTTTLKDLYVQLTDNTQSLTLGGNLIVNGNIHLNMGKLDFSGKQLTFDGDLIIASGAMFTSSATSNLTIEGSTSLTNGLTFTSGSSVNNLTINHTGSSNIKLMSVLNIAGILQLMSGTFSLESGSTLVMNAASTVQIEAGSIALNSGTFTGTASYDVAYMGGTAYSGPELTGAGLNNLTINLASALDSVRMNNNTTVSGTLSMQNGQFRLHGNTLIVNGSFDQNSSSMFLGTNSSELDLNLTSSANDTLFFSPGSFSVLGKLVVNAGSSSTIYLGSNLVIINQLVLTTGKIDIGDHDLTITSTGIISGYDDTKYVVTSGLGVLHMHINSASPYVTFPVGTTTGYSPASIQQTASGTSGDFMVSTMSGIFSAGTYGWNTANHGGSVVDRTWLVSAATGVTVNTNLKLGWLAAEEVNGFDRTNAYITHYHSSAWDTHAVAAATTGTASTYEMERLGLTSLSPFAVVDSSAGIALGINENLAEVTINLYPNPTNDVINIENHNVDDMYLYELVDVTGRTITAASNKNTLNTFNLSNLSMGFYFIKATDLTNKKVITKRFIKS